MTRPKEIDREAFVSACRAGASISELARLFGCSAPVVQRRKQKLKDDGVDLSTSVARRGRRKMWTAAEDERLRTMSAAGCRQSAIALACNVSVNAVYHRLMHLRSANSRPTADDIPPHLKCGVDIISLKQWLARLALACAKPAESRARIAARLCPNGGELARLIAHADHLYPDIVPPHADGRPWNWRRHIDPTRISGQGQSPLCDVIERAR